MSVLIIGCPDDPHINAITTQLFTNGNDPIVINAYADLSDFEYRFSKNQINVGIASQDLQSINSIYWRHSTLMDNPDAVMTMRELYQKQEIWNFLFALDTVSNIKCLNPIQISLKMENKLIQLSLAVQNSFDIPNTLVTGNKNNIAKFIKNKASQFIEKSLGISWTDNNDPSEAHLLNMDKLVASSCLPSIIQQRIYRQIELRIYVIGNTVIPIEILINPTYQHQVDWRSVDYDARTYRRYNLSCSLEESILKYHQGSNLIYAAYDVIMDEHNQAYFLDCNPSGNWLFLPEDIASEITKAICNELTSG